MRKLLLVIMVACIAFVGFVAFSYTEVLQWTNLSDDTFRSVVVYRGYITYTSVRFPETQRALVENMLENLIMETRTHTTAYTARDHIWFTIGYQDPHNWSLGPMRFEFLEGPGQTQRRIIIIPSPITVMAPLVIGALGIPAALYRISKRRRG